MARLQLALRVKTSNTPVPAGQPNLASRRLVWTRVNRNISLHSARRAAPLSGPIDFRRKPLLFSTFLYFCLLLSTFVYFSSDCAWRMPSCLPTLCSLLSTGSLNDPL